MLPLDEPLPSRSVVGADFRTTHWSRVLKASEGNSTQAQEALGKLCQTYWYPLYAYVRRRGYDVPDAEDLTQSFFAQALEKDYLKQADRARGRFRTFLLTALNHFVDNEWHRSRALKRGGEFSFISWEAQTAEERYGREPFHDLTAEKIYERRWATTVLETAIMELKRDYERDGKGQLFETLQGCLSGEKNPQSYAEIAATLGMSEGAVKVAVHRLRRSFGALLRAEIAQTVSSPDQIDDELRHALTSLS